MPDEVKDLAVLVADLDAESGLETLLQRGHVLGFRAMTFEFFRHPNRDNGVFQKGHDLLRAQSKRFQYAIAICDLEGCGRERHPPEQIETNMEQRLRANGWEDRAAAIVITPELENWVWGDWDALADQVQWAGSGHGLRDWLTERSLVSPGDKKPHRPKEALERVLRQKNMPASSSLFAALGSAADTSSCADAAFAKLLTMLRRWFPR